MDLLKYSSDYGWSFAYLSTSLEHQKTSNSIDGMHMCIIDASAVDMEVISLCTIVMIVHSDISVPHDSFHQFTQTGCSMNAATEFRWDPYLVKLIQFLDSNHFTSSIIYIHVRDRNLGLTSIKYSVNFNRYASPSSY